MLVAGVDGCKAGWVVVSAVDAARGGLEIVDVAAALCFADVLALTRSRDAVAVDIPIGLAADGPRDADREARRLLGPRRSSVFPAPVRAALAACDDYGAACALSEAACGKRLGKQLFNILPKIREADDALSPSDQRRVVESHPELSFATLNRGVPMAHNKKRPEGRALRLACLTSTFKGIERLQRNRGVSYDDVYDACVLAWTAARFARGEACRVPQTPQLDARGLRMEIVY